MTTRRTIRRGSKGDDVRRWQAFLLMDGYRIGLADGNFGQKTETATKQFQSKKKLKADGIVGPRTWKFVPNNFIPVLPAIPVNKPSSNNNNNNKPSAPSKPSNLVWPKQDYNSMVNFYGPVGENQTKLTLPYPMKLAWGTSTTLIRITCHKKCSESFYNIFEKTLNQYGQKEITRLRLDLFGGCLNVRKMRGSSAWSTHSWGCAIDLDPDRNQLKWGRDRATFARKEYEPFWKIVENEGAVSLGRARNFDWMHFQFAKL
jgi:peptidoglycan hydrolase-like protein with peptidoglycan-binding domain